MMDSSVLARMEMAGDLEALALDGGTELPKSSATRSRRPQLRSVSAGPVWFFLEPSREWFWRDEEGRYWLVHSGRRGVALPQMEFWIPPGLKPVHLRSKKGPQVPQEAKRVVSALGGGSGSS